MVVTPPRGSGVPDALLCLCPQVSRHLPKLFDSLAKLKFKMSPDKKPLKVGLGMFSRDEEYVPLDADCDLSGQVSRAPRSLGRGGRGGGRRGTGTLSHAARRSSCRMQLRRLSAKENPGDGLCVRGVGQRGSRINHVTPRQPRGRP